MARRRTSWLNMNADGKWEVVKFGKVVAVTASYDEALAILENR